MTTWSKTPPSEPGWYWLRLGNVGLPTAGDMWRSGYWNLPGTHGSQSSDELEDEGFEFGPRIPSPEAIEAAKDALREAANNAERIEGGERLAAIYRAAFAKRGP